MYTLLTGATGLVGRYVVRDLLLNGHQLAVVVRPSKKHSPSERMEQVLQHWESELGRALPRPVVLSGNISDADFGLSASDKDWVTTNVDKIIHSAAILEFYGEDRNGEPWRTNLGGTRNMIELCRDCKIHDIHYVSTAYVAGLQTCRIMEDSLDAGQKFRNDYEESKFLAETEVRAIDFADHVTVYRPAVISGDSVTGYTNTYHGIYLYLRLMALMIPAQPADENGWRHSPIRLRMDGTERRNIIPVDWVSAVTVRLFETPEARGGTYHMAPDKPMSSGDMINWCSNYFKSTGAELCGRDFVPQETREENEDQWMFERLIVENMGTYEPYETTDNDYDMSQLKKFTADIVCPEIDETVIRRYIEFGTEDRWGKRKPTKAVVEFTANELLAQRQNSEAVEGELQEVGFDVLGPGGTQVTVEFNSSGIAKITNGLPLSEQTPVLRLSVDELQQAIDDPAEVSRFVENADGNALGELQQMLSKQAQMA